MSTALQTHENPGEVGKGDKYGGPESSHPSKAASPTFQHNGKIKGTCNRQWLGLVLSPDAARIGSVDKARRKFTFNYPSARSTSNPSIWIRLNPFP